MRVYCRRGVHRNGLAERAVVVPGWHVALLAVATMLRGRFVRRAAVMIVMVIAPVTVGMASGVCAALVPAMGMAQVH